jgi:hypothetical protein
VSNEEQEFELAMVAFSLDVASLGERHCMHLENYTSF